MPTHCHTEMSESVGRAVDVRPSSGVWTIPHSGLRMRRQAKPTMTTDNVVGMKISVRYTLAPRSRWTVSRAASARPTGFCTRQWNRKNWMFCRSARQNRSDQTAWPNSVRKLSSPTQ